MLRNLYADTRSILINRSFRIGLAAVVAYQVLFFLIIWLIQTVLLKEALRAEDIGFSFSMVAAFLVTGSALYISGNEFSYGCIRNKVISGVGRTDIFLSAVCGGIFQGVMYSMLACVSSVAATSLFTGGYMSYSIPEIAEYWIVITMTCASIGAFSTALVITFGGGKISYGIGFSLVFLMNIISARIVDKLYPNDGLCGLTGTKLTAYTFFDRFVPYSYFTATPHYDMGSYAVGCAGLVLISTAIGLIVFKNKELR